MPTSATLSAYGAAIPLALEDVRGMAAPAILAIVHSGHEDTSTALQPDSQH